MQLTVGIQVQGSPFQAARYEEHLSCTKMSEPRSSNTASGRSGLSIFKCAAVIMILYLVSFSLTLKSHNVSDKPASNETSVLHHPLLYNATIPFPAISIFSVTQVSEARLKSILSANPKFKQIHYKAVTRSLSYMINMNGSLNQEKDLAYLTNLYREANITSNDLFELLKQSVPTCRDVVKNCSWRNDTESCYDYFDLLPTESGLSCVFNGAHYYDPDLGIVPKPRERRYLIDNSTESSELSFILDTHDYDYVVKNHSFGGLKVLIHASKTLPADMNGREFPIRPGSSTSVEVTITGENVTEDATASPQNKKKCTDDEERNGRFSISFSESACIQKCANRVIRDTFHCEPYFFLAEARMPFCDSISTPKIRDTFSDVKTNPEKYNCDCLPPCRDELLIAKISVGEFHAGPTGSNQAQTFKQLTSTQNSDVLNSSYLGSNMAEIRVSYRRNRVTTTPLASATKGN